MYKTIEECKKQIKLSRNPIEQQAVNKKEYEDLRKLILSNTIFTQKNKLNEETFKIAKGYYQKLLNRCPLNKMRLKKEVTLPIKGFVTLDLTRDNLGRAMRLKKMKSPLNNPSILKGLSYVRGFFLKRAMIMSIGKKKESKDFLVTSKEHSILLKLLMKYNDREELKKIKEVRVNSCLSRICVPSAELYSNKAKVECEIIKIDHSIFGLLKLSKNLLRFETKKRDDKKEYQFGSTILMQSDEKYKKVWKLCDIVKVTAKYYNLIRQALEITTNKHKKIFLIFFTEKGLNDLIAVIRKAIPSAVIIEDPKKEFYNRKSTDKWKKGKLTNFEYLMELNEYSSRSSAILSQYPVFPWILQNYTEETLTFEPRAFRDLHFPMAGITKKKRDEAMKKYKNTDDFPGGQFQNGSHYLPALGVLGYLTRIQPYTSMHYNFHPQGDSPSRIFHFIYVMWRNLNEQAESNLELIPEFYYNYEFLANLYYALLMIGTKYLLE